MYLLFSAKGIPKGILIQWHIKIPRKQRPWKNFTYQDGEITYSLPLDISECERRVL